MKDNILEKMYQYSEIREVLDHSEFLSLSNFYHHGNQTRLKHTIEVAELVYIAAEIRNLDVVSAVRGALLHDFYFYDHNKVKKKVHLKGHPQIALNNALENFELNAIEEDAIVNHMWPITSLRPQFKESRLVSMADKFVSIIDMRKKAQLSMRNAGARFKIQRVS